MIVDLLVGIVLGIFNAVFSLLPDWALGLPSTVAVAIGQYAGLANELLPIDHMFGAMGVLLGARVFTGGWSFLTWVYDRLPFKSS